MIITTNLGKSYGAHTLFDGVSLNLNAGSRYGLVGANGSGKTTLVRVLAGNECWLVKFLGAYKGCALIISHDQRFLDNVASHVLDIALLEAEQADVERRMDALMREWEALETEIAQL